MANTIFSTGDIIEGSYKGIVYKFRAEKDGVEGSGSIYGEGVDLLSNKRVFLKKYIDPAPRAEWFQEFIAYQNEIQRRIEHSQNAQQLIAKIHLYFQEENNRIEGGYGRFWQVIEYVENSKNLKEYLNTEISWEQRKVFATVFMFAMSVLHDELKLVHGDLKPANLLFVPLDSQHCQMKLIDFDRPILTDVEKIPWAAEEGYLGSPGYYSPEHKRGERPTEKSDIFTCGLILYELLTEEGHPFNGKDILMPYEHNEAPKPHLLVSFGSEEQDSKIAELLHRMLDPKAENRPSAKEVHEILKQSSADSCGSNGSEMLKRKMKKLSTQGVKKEKNADSKCKVSNDKTESSGNVLAADIVFLIDSTGSMSPCIDALKEHIYQFVDSLVAGNSEDHVTPVENWRARVVGYRDFLDCNKNEKIAKMYKKFGKGGWFLSNPFTRNTDVLHSQLDCLKPFGGGKENEESLLDALMLVLKSGRLSRGQEDSETAEEDCSWRANNVGRVVIVFTDAGYHQKMSYDYTKTRFEEGDKDLYQIDLKGAGMDELEHAIETGSFKIYVFAPNIGCYQELGELSNLLTFSFEDASDGLINTVSDESKFNQVIETIIKGVSRSASDFREIIV